MGRAAHGMTRIEKRRREWVHETPLRRSDGESGHAMSGPHGSGGNGPNKPSASLRFLAIVSQTLLRHRAWRWRTRISVIDRPWRASARRSALRRLHDVKAFQMAEPPEPY